MILKKKKPEPLVFGKNYFGFSSNYIILPHGMTKEKYYELEEEARATKKPAVFDGQSWISI